MRRVTTTTVSPSTALFLPRAEQLVLSWLVFAAASPAFNQSRNGPQRFVDVVGRLELARDVGC